MSRRRHDRPQKAMVCPTWTRRLVVLLDRLKAYIQDPPANLAVEISEAGLAGARLGTRTELGFAPLKPGALRCRRCRKT